MSSPILCGIETEFGIFVRGADLTPMMASSLIVNAYSDEGLALRVWDFASETPNIDALEGWRPEADYPEVEVLMANTVLTNGARFYVDHAHPEVSTPECRSVSDVVLYDRAAEEIIRRAMKRANERLPDGVELVLHKNNSDGKGNSYGCHENYLVPRSVPFGKIASYLTSHFVTRQTFTGAGKVGTECIREGETPASFQLSQRADFFEEEIGLETTVRRPIINTRDEPHCDPERWRRLHVIAGDANMSELATFLKVGTTALLLGMIEDVERVGDARKYVKDLMDRGERLMGFGHRVYRAEDPRARTLRRTAKELGAPRYDVALELEKAALAELHERHPERVLETNVEFWAAIVLDFAEVPGPLFTSMFTAARTAGWSAHILEQKRTGRLIRPSARYIGKAPRKPEDVQGWDATVHQLHN